MTKTGWVLSVIFAAFMLLASALPKLLMLDVATTSMTALGWPEHNLILIGIMELLFTILFLVPRTAWLGAVLMTGLIGGAIASHLRVASPLFSHTLFGVYLGAIMWIALWLRDEQFRKYVYRNS